MTILAEAVSVIPKEFFTLQSMLTLSGATGATYVVANGVQRAFGFNPRWLALAIALAISLYGTYLTADKGSDYFVGLVNGFLVYSTAAGASATFGTPVPQVAKGADSASRSQPPPSNRRFFTTWF